MEMKNIPFSTTDWTKIEAVENKGETGTGFWKTCEFNNINLHMVEYSAGYLADHWCYKGHMLFCIEGELNTELKDGRTFTLTPGMTYQVADDTIAHRSSTAVGAKLFIVD
ncbi:DHCW motif cupin fold protein [Psychrobacter glacincola]|uniref:DHCW motif cupin fold protein n=1 Tax=Psychrobacter glacincola TaxID=56810 RepID=UPI0039B0D4DB